MKKTIAVFVFACFLASSLLADSLISAIDSSNAPKVTMLLGTYEHLNKNYQQILLCTAQEACLLAESELSFWRSPKDMALTAASAGFLSLQLALTHSKVQQMFNYSWGSDADKGGLILWGSAWVFFMYKGITLMYAREKLKAAQEIYKMIDQKLVKDI